MSKKHKCHSELCFWRDEESGDSSVVRTDYLRTTTLARRICHAIGRSASGGKIRPHRETI
jgi:hypothetical protein